MATFSEITEKECVKDVSSGYRRRVTGTAHLRTLLYTALSLDSTFL